MGERNGSLWEYDLPDNRELVVYPLLFGQARLVIGEKGRDQWERGYDYFTPEEAITAAEKWTDTTGPPPGPWVKAIDEDAHDPRDRHL